MSLAPMTSLEEEHRRMSLKPPITLAPVQETQGRKMTLKNADLVRAFGNNVIKPQKSGTNKFDPKARRMSRALPTMRRDFFINRKNQSGDTPETPEPEEILDDEVLFSRLQKTFIAAEEDGKTDFLL